MLLPSRQATTARQATTTSTNPSATTVVQQPLPSNAPNVFYDDCYDPGNGHHLGCIANTNGNGNAYSSKSCCGPFHGDGFVSIRWFIVCIAAAGVVCSVLGTVLGALKAAGRDQLYVGLLLIGELYKGTGWF